VQSEFRLALTVKGSSMADFLTYEQSGNIVTLTMNCPDTRNAVSGEVAGDFEEACDRIARDRSVRAVVLTGAGSSFSSGGNVKTMSQRYGVGRESAATTRMKAKDGIQRIPRCLYNLEVPTIAAVNGPAMGAGLDIACMCDIRIASSTAVFAESFVKLGLVPADGGAWLLPRIVGVSRAAEMAFTGDSLNAVEALKCGLVSRVVAPDALVNEAQQLAQRIAANSGPAVRMAKRLLLEGQNLSLEASLELAAALQAIAFQTSQYREAVAARAEKRSPIFDDD